MAEFIGESGLPADVEEFVHAWAAGGYGKGGPAYRETHPKVSKVTAGKKAGELLEDPIVKAYARGILKSHLDKYEVTEENIIAELSNIAFLDIADFVDDDGSVHGNVRDIPEKARRAIASISEGLNGRVHVKACNKEKALELLAKYKKMLTDMHVVSTDDDLMAAIMRGRERAGIVVNVPVGGAVKVSMEDVLK